MKDIAFPTFTVAKYIDAWTSWDYLRVSWHGSFCQVSWFSVLSSSVSHFSIHTLSHGLVVSNLSVHGVAQVQCIYRVKSNLAATCDLGPQSQTCNSYMWASGPNTGRWIQELTYMDPWTSWIYQASAKLQCSVLLALLFYRTYWHRQHFCSGSSSICGMREIHPSRDIV